MKKILLIPPTLGLATLIKVLLILPNLGLTITGSLIIYPYILWTLPAPLYAGSPYRTATQHFAG